MNTITTSFIPTIAELKHYYKYVSSHINQTMLVNDLLNKWIVPYEEITGLYNSETDEYTEVFQWLVFPNFWKYDYEKLIENNIPVIESEYETWIWITSYGSHYDLYVYPQFINILFGTDISYEDIQRIS